MLSEPNLLQGLRKDKKKGGGGPGSSGNEVILQKTSHIVDEQPFPGNQGERRSLPAVTLLAPTWGRASVRTVNRLRPE